MRIRWSRKSAVPLLLLAVLYAAGAAQLSRSYARCDLSLPGKLASGIEWAESGWNWFAQASSRLRLGSWLGNSWAPGSIGWSAAADSPSNLRSDSGTLTAHAAAPAPALGTDWPQLEPLEVAVELKRVRFADCRTRRVLLLARPEVVIVTAQFPRLPVSESRLSELPDRHNPASQTQPPSRTGCPTAPFLPDPSTI